GSTKLTGEMDWLKSSHLPGSLKDGRLHLPMLSSLPPGTYTLTLSMSDSHSKGIGLTRPDGTFRGLYTDLGVLNVAPATSQQSVTRLPIPLDITLPGLHIRAISRIEEVLYAGDPLHFRLEAARTSEPLTETINWAALCNDTLQMEGDILALPGSPEEWPTDHYYELRYNPRTPGEIVDTGYELVIKSETTLPVPVGAIKLRARERIFTLSQTPQKTMDILISDFGKLVGFDLLPPTISPDSILSLTLYWRTQQPTNINYTTFVHLTGGDDVIWTQSDGVPAQGNAPTTTWVTDQIIVDNHQLDVPANIPSGEYRLYTGLYDAETGYRASLYNSSGERIEGDQILIKTIVLP
ncbi:MAG: hypothetical protein P1S60_17040, partial [Anaerolineae bacterium]|nr:hypothetical protein [Anaerolineae bacterium]